MVATVRTARRAARAEMREDARASRVASLLSSYYDEDARTARDATSARDESTTRDGTHRAKTTTTTTTTGRATRASVDLDSPDFDVDAYVRETLANGDGGGARDAYARVSAELGVVESRAQMLVYDNYGKFIQVTRKSARRAMRGTDGWLGGDRRRARRARCERRARRCGRDATRCGRARCGRKR